MRQESTVFGAFLRVAIATVLLLATSAADAAKDTKDKSAKKDDDDKPKWDVSKPPGTWRTISIDTDETTWSYVDVSPDGKTIVFDMLGDLYTVPLTGGEAKSLTEGIAWDVQPRYSPDGRLIAFISDRAGGDNLWIMNADGTKPRAVSEEKENLVHNPYWSPDGDYVAAKKGFTSTRSIPAGEIWLFHAGGGGGLQLVERPNKEKDQKNIAEPAFSPDGRYVYFSQDVTPGLRWEYDKDSTGRIFAIKRLDRETGEVITFVDGPGGAIRPTPSPDGRSLAFVRRLPTLESAIYVKDLESGLELPVYLDLERDLQETNGCQGNTTAFAWTPDNRSLVFWSGGKIQRVDVATREVAAIPVRVKTTRQVAETLRFPVDVAPDEVPIKMIRWAQMSPDGSRVVFQALGYLWTRDTAGGEPRRLTAQTDHFEQWPSFSRDGRSIVYTTWDDEQLGSIRIVPTTGGASRIVSDKPGHYVEPRFSPGGERIVYRKLGGGYLLSGNWSMEPGLHVVPTAGGESKKVSSSGFNAHFGADGERVYFSDEVEETHLVLKSVNLEGLDERTHLDGATITEFNVSPDGEWVAFTEQYNAYVAPFAATGKKVDMATDSKALPVKQVSKRSGEFLHWSANGESLHWAHGATLFTRDLKDAFTFLAGAPEELPEPVTTGLDLGFEVPADRPQGTVALVGGRVVTMRDARKQREVIDNGVVLVEGHRIKAVGRRSEVQIPTGAKIVDVTGKTVIPGLIDVHAHGAQARDGIIPQQNWMQYSNLAFGVTTIHDPSNETSSIFAASELQRTGDIVGPRIFSTGTILYGAHAPAYHASVDDLDEAKFHVQRLKDVGAISVKSYQQPRRDQRQQVIEAGRELKVMVVPEGGAKFQHNMTEIVDGHTGIEHALPLIRAYEDVLQLWSQTGTGYTPTLGVAYGGISGENYWYAQTDVWRDERLMAFAPRSVIEPRSMRRSKAPEEHYNHKYVAAFAKQLVDRGGRVQLGAHGQREGLAAHWELWMLEQGGFTPWEALRAGTIDGAHYLGMDRDLGSIEPGKLADLAVIEGDPLEDVRQSEHVAYTMINGRLYESETMTQLAPEHVEREPFFFEREGGDTVHPTTWTWLEELGQRYGWVH